MLQRPTRHRSATNPLLLLAALIGLLAALPGQAVRPSLAADYALAADRAKVLEALVPGTIEYYYYHCLHAQHTGAFVEVEPLLATWIGRHGRSSLVVEIENRQALLTFASDPEGTYDYLRERLGLRYDAQRQVAGERSDLPTQLDPAELSRTRLTARAIQLHPNTLDGLRDSALAAFAASGVPDALLTEFLRRLGRPDLPNLPALIVRQLQLKNSGGFGSIRIHNQLLKSQLDELLRMRPALLEDPDFVATYLPRLLPSADVDWRNDAAARGAYLDRLAQFVDRLSSAHNALKSHVLYHVLMQGLEAGAVDRERFLAYLRLPRRSSYINQDFLRRSRGAEIVRAGGKFATGMPVVRDDEKLVRLCFEQIFQTEDSFAPYAEFVSEDWLKRVFAETKILRGEGDMERWYSLLNDPGYYQRLVDRVDLRFPLSQRRYFAVNDDVSVDVDVKNVETLLIKLFEIDAYAFLRDNGRGVDESIDLDGVMANHEFVHRYDEPSLRRVRRTFEFPQLAGAGTWVVEFVGNGLSSRAVIQKGRLHALERIGSAGHVLTVFDEQGQVVKDAAIFVAAKEYVSDESGEIAVPFSPKPQRRAMVLRDGPIASLQWLHHQAETYQLLARAFVDREGLKDGNRARLLIRPALSVHGVPVALDLLQNSAIDVSAKTRDGVSSLKTIRSPEWRDNGDFVYEFEVPDDLASLSVAVRGAVENLSAGKVDQLEATTPAFDVNGIDATAEIFAPMLGRSGESWFLELRGKTGEPLAGRAVRLQLNHRGYTDPIAVELATDEAGRIGLGRLEGITRVQAGGFATVLGAWQLGDVDRPARYMTGVAGETFFVPYSGKAAQVDRSVANLLEYRGGRPYRDVSVRLAMTPGFVVVRELPAGDYQLVLPETGDWISMQVTGGTKIADWAVGASRAMRLVGRQQLQIRDIVTDGTNVSVDLAYASETARVHLFSTRYLPAYPPLQRLGLPPVADRWSLEIAPNASTYAEGRQLADEMRYVLERRYASKYPGNMLSRPGMLLNPWALVDYSEVDGIGGGAGGRFGGRGAARAGPSAPGAAAAGDSGGPNPGSFVNLDFLPGPALLLTNLRANAQGQLVLPRAALGNGQHLHVVVVDGNQTAYGSVALDVEPLEPRDRALRTGFDPQGNFAQQRRIEFISPGSEAVIEDRTTAELEMLTTLADAHRLLRTLGGEEALARFAFVLRWPTLSNEEKRAMYREFACHELHFFLRQKDRAFFDEVLRPYLANKAHKTFLDRWLLDDDLRSFLEPWAFAQLNLVEKILLLQRLPGQRDALARYVREQGELLPVNLERQRLLFLGALKSGELVDGDNAGFLTLGMGARPDMNGAFDSNQWDSAIGLGGGRTRSLRGAGDTVPPAPELQDQEALEEVERSAEGAGREAGRLGKAEQKQKAITGSEMFFMEPSAQRGREQAQADRMRRKAMRQMYRAPDPTRRYAEQDYWQRTKQEEDPRLIAANAFWRDFAVAPADQPFVSRHLAETAGSFTEAMLALAVLDLPFLAEDPVEEIDGSRLILKPGTPLLLVRSEILPAKPAADTVSVLVQQDHYRLDDSHTFNGADMRAKYVRDEFLVGVGYGCQVVVTNPTGTPRRVELLMQIPEGALPLQGGFVTRSVPVQLGAFATQRLQFAFYFPAPGEYQQFPVHVNADGAMLAAAKAQPMRVVAAPTRLDTQSWEMVSQDATAAEVLTFLGEANLARLDLGRMAWRLRDREFFQAATKLLRDRFTYDDVVWSYALLHREQQEAQEYVSHQDQFVASCGEMLRSPLLTIDPIARHFYQHIEFDPLFHSRSHRIGPWQGIANSDVASQWAEFVGLMRMKSQLDSSDWMSATIYLLLQGRIEEAIATFDRVDRSVLPTQLQYDYMTAYLAFYRADPETALAVASRYEDYPVDRWRLRFAEVLQQVAEIRGGAVTAVDSTDREQDQGALAAREPMLDIAVSEGRVVIKHENLDSCEVRYHLLDVEFAFSTSPFADQGASSVAWVQPRRKDRVALATDRNETVVPMPAEFGRGNVVVEVRAGGISRRTTSLASTMTVQTMEGYGQLQVASADGDALPKVYVKVFAKMPGGEVRFHKDGYTDLRGRFDYASVSAQRTRGAERYAILVLSEQQGAAIRQVTPPGT